MMLSARRRRARNGGVAFVGALDALPAQAIVYGVRRLRAGYTGALIRVRRSSDNTEQDIGSIATGDLDTTALTAFVGAGSGYVTTWYDQSGNARNAVQATQASQPRVVNAGVVDALGGKPSVVFSGAQVLEWSGTTIVNGTVVLANAVAAIGSGATGYARVLSLSAGGQDYNNAASMAIGRVSTTAAVQAFRNSGSFNSVPIVYGQLSALTTQFNGSNNLPSVNNFDGVTAASSGSFGVTRVMLGNSPDGAFLTGNISEIVVMASTLADVDRESLIVNQMYWFNLGSGYLANGLRKKANRPFSVASHYNQPIKSSAQRVAAGIVYTQVSGGESGYPTRVTADKSVIVMQPAAASLTVNYSSVGWDVGDRCNTTGGFGGFPQTVQCPTSYVLPDSDENNVGFFLSPSNVVKHNNAFTRCVAAGNATAFRAWPDTDITGDSILGAHGGSGVGGGVAIRGGEWTDGLIRHTIGINLHAAKYYKNNGAGASHVEPATTEDNYWASYGGTNPYLMPGSLFVLPTNFNLGALRTKAGRTLARVLIFHGALGLDDSHYNNWAFAMSQGPDEDSETEFATVHGFAFAQTSHTVGSESAFMLDMIDIVQALQIVTNNTLAGGWGGGSGTPLVPVVLAIGD